MMIRVRSKTAVAASIVIVCSLLLTGGVLAYLIHYDDAGNVFTVGSQISEVQEIWSPPGSFEKGQQYTKEVSVKNTGTAPCYVRVMAEIQEPAAVNIDWNSSKWSSKQSDGYYYYDGVLDPGERTEPLLTTITAKENLDTFDMIIYEESVQTLGAKNAQEAFEGGQK